MTFYDKDDIAKVAEAIRDSKMRPEWDNRALHADYGEIGHRFAQLDDWAAFKGLERVDLRSFILGWGTAVNKINREFAADTKRIGKPTSLKSADGNFRAEISPQDRRWPAYNEWNLALSERSSDGDMALKGIHMGSEAYLLRLGRGWCGLPQEDSKAKATTDGEAEDG